MGVLRQAFVEQRALNRLALRTKLPLVGSAGLAAAAAAEKAKASGGYVEVRIYSY